MRLGAFAGLLFLLLLLLLLLLFLFLLLLLEKLLLFLLLLLLLFCPAVVSFVLRFYIERKTIKKTDNNFQLLFVL